MQTREVTVSKLIKISIKLGVLSFSYCFFKTAKAILLQTHRLLNFMVVD